MERADQYTDQDLVDLVGPLTLYANWLMRSKTWRGWPGVADMAMTGGIEPADLAHHAVCAHLDGSRSYEGADLAGLKWFLRGTIRSLVWGLATSLENRKTREPARAVASSSGRDSRVQALALTPDLHAMAEEARMEQIWRLIGKALSRDPLAEQVGRLAVVGDLRPAQIAAATGCSVTTIYNARKRFIRAASRVIAAIDRNEP